MLNILKINIPKNLRGQARVDSSLVATITQMVKASDEKDPRVRPGELRMPVCNPGQKFCTLRVPTSQIPMVEAWMGEINPTPVWVMWTVRWPDRSAQWTTNIHIRPTRISDDNLVHFQARCFIVE